MKENTFKSISHLLGYLHRGMSIFVGVTILIVLLLPLELVAEDTDNNSTLRTLDNGFKVLLVQRDRIPLVNIAFAINVGTKDESPDSSGLVHLLEHLILLGTTEFNSSEKMNQMMRGYGAHFNAHTNHDVMTFEFSLPAKYWKEGLNLLKEKLFHLKFSPEELEKEKTIIFEEIAQNKDDPYKRGMMLAMQTLFKNHPYEKPLAGTPETIRKITVQHLETFYKHFFVPSNCALAIVGDMDVNIMDNQIEGIFGSLFKGENVPPNPSIPMTKPLTENIMITENMDIREARLIIGFYTPPANHPDNIAVEVFGQILGKGLSPLLSGLLFKRGKRISYNVSTSYISLAHGGAFLVFLTLDAQDIKFAQTAIFNFFNKTAWKFKYSTENYPSDQQPYITDYLETAKNKMKFNHQEFQEQGINAALSYARYILYYYHDTPKTAGQETKEELSYMDQLEKLSSSEIRSVATRYFNGKKHMVIALIPNKKKQDWSK